MPPTGPQLEHAIKRNFGGFKSEKFNPFEEFTKLIPIDPEVPQVSEEVSLGLYYYRVAARR